MGNFVPDVSANAAGGIKVQNQLKSTLRELDIRVSEDGSGSMHTEFTPGSYDPVKVRFFFPEDTGMVGIEGELLELGGEATEELRVAINYLNVEVDTYRFYVGEDLVLVRHDLLPNQDKDPVYHPRELRQALTGLCAQKAIFADSLKQVQGGRSWRYVKDALKAFR